MNDEQRAREMVAELRSWKSATTIELEILIQRGLEQMRADIREDLPPEGEASSPSGPDPRLEGLKLALSLIGRMNSLVAEQMVRPLLEKKIAELDGGAEAGEPEPCPWCGLGSPQSPEILWGDEDFYVVCPSCYSRGPRRSSQASAVRSWNVAPRASAPDGPLVMAPGGRLGPDPEPEKPADEPASRYWISWNEYAEDYRPKTFPPGAGVLGWWRSGEAGDGSYSTLCAAVETTGDPWDVIEADWPGAREHERFCNPVEEDFTPGDRFPLDSDWMFERFGVEKPRAQ